MKLHSAQTLLFLLAVASFTNQWCNASQGSVRVHSRDLNNGKNKGKNKDNNKGKNKGKKGKKGAKKGKKGKKGKKSAERAITMWWILFNKPSECAANPDGDVQCGMPDIMEVAQGGPNDAEIVIMHASGGIPNMDGTLRMTASLYKTCTKDLNLVADTGGALAGHYTWGGPPSLFNATTGSTGYCPADGETTEVHIVLRDHGPVTENKLWQITRFTDPSCSGDNGGPNLCVDNGIVAFPPMATDGLMTKDIGNFPMYPAGCAKAGDCEANVEAVQLTAGMGNEITLIKVGDALQVVAEITAPKV